MCSIGTTFHYLSYCGKRRQTVERIGAAPVRHYPRPLLVRVGRVASGAPNRKVALNPSEWPANPMTTERVYAGSTSQSN